MTCSVWRKIIDAARRSSRTFCLVLALLIAATPPAAALLVSGENASDILGQFSSPSSDTTPVYTKGCPNNGASQIGFDTNSGSAIDATNHWLFVPEQYNNRVVVFPLNSSNQISSKTASYVLGQTNFSTCATNEGNATTPSASSLNMGAGSLCVDAADQLLYVPDWGNNRVLVFSYGGGFTNGMNASYELGQPSGSNAFTTYGSAASQSGLYGPGACLYDSTNHRLYVADVGNNRVMVFSTSSLANGKNASYVLGQSSYTGSGAATTQAGLSTPTGLSLDSGDSLLYVTDAGNNRIVAYSTSSLANGENASYVFGQSSYTGGSANEGGSTSQISLYGPSAAAYDSVNSRVYVSDYYNNRALVYNTANVINGENAFDILGEFTSPSSDVTADYTKYCENNGASPIGFYDPYSGIIDPVNHWLFVGDSGNNRVMVFPLNSSNQLSSKTASYVLGQSSMVNCAENGGTAWGLYEDSTDYGMSMAVDPVNQLLYVPSANTGGVMVFSTASMSNGENASYVIGLLYLGAYGQATSQSRMNTPTAATLDNTNHLLYVADSYNSRVMVFPAYGNASWAGTGENALYVLGQSSWTGNAGSTSQTGLNTPADVKLDTTNNLLYVADAGNNRVMVFPAYGNASWGGSNENALYELGQPSGTAFTSSGAATSQSGLNGPQYVAVDPANSRVFVGDTGNSRVMIFPTASLSNGENASYVLGSSNFTSQNWGTSQSQFADHTGGIIYDSTNDLLYVGDNQNNRVMIFNATPVTQPTPSVISQGGHDACLATGTGSGGKLYCWGYNNDGQDGLGNSTQYTLPQQVGSATTWTTVSQADPQFDPAACGINNGQLYCWGQNTNGELGQGNTTAYNTPTLVTLPSGVTSWSAVSTSGKDTCAIANTGSLYCWGINTYGELGLGNTTQYKSPQKVGAATNWIAVSTGGYDTCGIQGSSGSGSLYCWGEDKYGEAGQGTMVFVSSTTHNGDWGTSAAAAITAANSACQSASTTSGTLAPTGTYDAWIGDSSTAPSSSFTQSSIPYEDVDGHVIALNWSGLTGSSLVYGIQYSELGGTALTGDAWTNVATSGAVEHSGSSTADNCASWSNGTTDTGYYGVIGSATASWTYASADTTTCSNTEHLYCFEQSGSSAITSPTQVGTATNWVAVSQGGYDTCGIQGSSGSGSLWCWGYNKNGELGLGNTTDFASPQQAGSATTWTSISIQNDGTNQNSACGVNNGGLYCWGQNTYGQLGTGGTTTSEVSTNQVGSSTTWTAVSYGNDNTCAYNSAGTLYCWGYNNDGQDGVGTTSENKSPVAVTLVTLNNENATDLLGEYSSPSSTATVEWTQNGMNNGPTALGFNAPQGVALDSVHHQLFVSDDDNSRVLVYNLTSSNTLPTTSGGHTASYVIGQTSLDGVAVASSGQAQLQYPIGLAVDAVNNRLFIADSENSRVMVFSTPITSNGPNAIGVLGNTTYGWVTGTSTQSTFNIPTDVAYDSVNQNLYVADLNNNRVLVFNVAPGFSNGENASYVIGQTNFTNNGTAVTQSGFNSPGALSYDSINNRLFVVDNSNARVMVFSTAALSNGMNATNVVGQASFTANTPANSQTGLDLPSGITYDATDGWLFVVNCEGQDILEYNAAPGALPTYSASANFVLGATTFAGSGNFNTTQSEMSLCGGAGWQITPIFYDPGSQQLFVSDEYNDRVMIFKANNPGNPVNNEAASYVLGQTSFTGNLSNLNWTDIAAQNSLSGPFGVAFDSTNDLLYVDDSNNSRLMQFNVAPSTIANGENASDELGQYTSSSSTATDAWTQSGMNNGPTALGMYFNFFGGMALDTKNHYFYVSDGLNSRVLVYALNADNSFPASSGGHTASYVLGQTSLQGQNTEGLYPTGLVYNTGLAYDAVNQRLFVANDGWIAVFSTAGGVSNGMNESYYLDGGGWGSAQNQLENAVGMAYDPNDNWLFVTDNQNNRVVVFNVAPGSITNAESPTYVLGQTGWTGTSCNQGGSSPTQSTLCSPGGVTYDAVNKRLFVSDNGNNRVMIYTNVSSGNLSNGENAAYVLGQSGFTTSSSSTGASGFSSPDDISFDSNSERLFVTDRYNNRVVVYNVAPGFSNGENASYVLGGTAFQFYGAVTTQTGFNASAAIFYDPGSGRLFVEDGGNNRIMIFEGSFGAPNFMQMLPD